MSSEDGPVEKEVFALCLADHGGSMTLGGLHLAVNDFVQVAAGVAARLAFQAWGPQAQGK